MPRCNECNKFVSLDTEQVEVDISIDSAEITGDMRVVRQCAECGNEMTEGNFDVSITLDEDVLEKHKDEKHPELESMDDISFEVEAKNEEGYEKNEEGGRKRMLYGGRFEYIVTCSVEKCGEKVIEGEWYDCQPASDFDDMQ
jgi:hypothetical protein